MKPRHADLLAQDLDDATLIRFIDRFTVAGGRLVDQMVWNDMGEVLGSKIRAPAT